MISLTRSMASLVTLPVFLPILVAAIPAPDPMITAPATLEKRANGANIIGFALTGTSWRTRSCNNGFFSTVGTVGNCCIDSDCDFITTCIGSYIYYDSGWSSDCGNVCGTGSIFKTIGDQSPLSMFNCQSDWTVTETVTSESDTTTTTSPSVMTTTEQGSTIMGSITEDDSDSTESATGAAATATASNREVTLTVTNPDGSQATSVSTDAAGASGTSPASADTSSDDPEATTPTSSSSSNAGAIAGGVVGGVAVLALIAGLVAFLLWKRKKNAAALEAAGLATPGPNNMGPPQGPYSPAMQENLAWQQNNNAYSYSQVPQQPGVYAPTQQDYKMPVAGGGYADSPQRPQMLGGTPVNHGPQELPGAQVHAPVEMPSQPYGR